MYRLYLLFCITSGGVVFGDSHEAKYIDLLPEQEKQEFLNRIARRIIQEIQNKDSPEQSQVEVSDDQLNQHNDYVRDLIKEESEYMRDERRDNVKENKDNTESSFIKHELEKEKLEEKPVSNENNRNIDLTLREDKHAENNEMKLTESSTINLIPVKVLYDDDYTKSYETTTDNSKMTSEKISSRSDNNDYIKTDVSYNNNNNTKTKSLNFSENIENINETSKNEPVVKENIQEKSIESLVVTEKTLVKDGKEERTDGDRFENTETSTNSDVNSHKNSLNNTQNDIELSYSDTTLLPLTEKPKIQEITPTKSKENQTQVLTSTVSMINTSMEIRTGNPNKESKSNINRYKASSNDKTDQDKLQHSINSNDGKNFLRKHLEKIPTENRLQNDNSRKKNIKKQYFVYEVSEENPLFVQMADSKEDEQPYMVPVYNFAPKNAYYNSYNHFGPNSDGDVEAIKQNSRYDNNKLLEELYLRNGVEIDLNPKRYNQLNNREGNYRVMKRSNPHWAHLLNSLFDNNRYSKGNVKLRRENKRDGSLQRTDRYYKPPKRPSKIIYTPLRQEVDTYLIDERTRRRKHKKYGRIGQRLPSSNEKDHPYNTIHKYADHIRAVKNLFYKRQKFGFLPPSPYTTTVEPSHKRVFDGGYGLDLSNDDKKERYKKKVKNIALDYYFGRFKPTNKTDDFDYVYPDTEDVNNFGSGKVKDFVNKHNKVNSYPYRMVADDDCDGGCVEIHPKSDETFKNYLNIVMKILKDMIYTDKKELISYNWLLSTVDMESAVKKLIDLTKKIERGKSIHPLDLRLLNYVVHLYSLAKNIPESELESNNNSNAFHDINYIVKSFLNLLRRRIALPKNKNKKKGPKHPIRLWYQYYIREGGNNDNGIPVRNARVLGSFKKFLMDLEDNVFELHNALKHIASITTYRAQNWYKDLKDIYLKSASKKELLEVILHLAASRLFGSIEETAENAEDDDLYVNNNRDVVRRIRNEFVFVLKILEVIKKINY